jgi:DNA-binding PadR family transcriptional regulator
MEDAGYLRANWEKATVAQREQRPARRYYEVTRLGTQALADARARYRLLADSPAPAPKPSPAKA